MFTDKEMAPGPDQLKQTIGHLDRINLVLDVVEENKDEHEEEEVEEEERGKTVENRKKMIAKIKIRLNGFKL